MLRLASVFFVIVFSTHLLAQSSLTDQKLTRDADVLLSVIVYCDTVEHSADSQVPRIFASRRASPLGESSEWVEFDNRDAWNRAGSPKPVALVWYRDAKIVRVEISPNDAESPKVYADYCYRQDGTLARLRSVPSVRRKCEPNGYQCTVVLRGGRLYPPKGPVVTTYGPTGEEPLPAERIVETFVPMEWPEYLHVTDLPFSELLYLR